MDKIASKAEKSRATDAVAASACPVKQNNPLTTGVNGLHLVERRRVELPTSALRMCKHPDTSADSKALTPTPSAACTSVCTSEGENANADALDTASLDTSPQAADAHHGNEGEGIDQGDPLARLATELRTLSLPDRTRLAVLLSRDS